MVILFPFLYFYIVELSGHTFSMYADLLIFIDWQSGTNGVSGSVTIWKLSRIFSSEAIMTKPDILNSILSTRKG